MGPPCGPLAPIWTNWKLRSIRDGVTVRRSLHDFRRSGSQRPPDQAALLVPIAATELVDVASNFLRSPVISSEATSTRLRPRSLA